MVSSLPPVPDTAIQETDHSIDQIPSYLRSTSSGSATEKFSILGIGVSSLRFDEALKFLLDAPRLGRRLRVHFAAMHTLVNAAEDPILAEDLNQAEAVLADGMPIVWLGRLQGCQVERCCGPDTMLALIDRSREQGSSHFFYGGEPAVVEDLAASLAEKLPGLKVAGVYSPPFRPLKADEIATTAQMINDSGADYIWVGLGSPKQDAWLASFRPLLRAPVLLAVGAAFDFHSGRKMRAPRWAQRSGCEWLFRLAAEPQRLAWRYAATSLRFGQLLVSQRLRRLAART